MVHYWALSIVRCPQATRYVNMSNNTTNSSHFFYSSSVVNFSSGVLRALLAGDPSSDSSASSDSSGSTLVGVEYPHELFRFASTTILFGTLAAMCLVFGILILAKFHGLETLEASRDDTAQPLIKKTVTSTTNNSQWALQFFANAIVNIISVLCLQIEDLTVDNEKSKIAVLVQRLFHGISCVYLAVALNYQRTERVKDYKDAKPNPQLKRQARLLNRTTFGVFIAFMIGEFVASHVITATGKAAEALFWVYIVMFGVMAVPPLMAATWVAFHEAEVQPSRFAKRLIIAAVVLHFFVMFPAELWNQYILRSFVQNSPCPLNSFSFFDMILMAHIPVYVMIFSFVVIEHRRNAVLGQTSYYQDVCERLNVATLPPPSASQSPRAAAGGNSNVGGYGSINAMNYSASYSPRNGSMLTNDVSLRSVEQTPKGGQHS